MDDRRRVRLQTLAVALAALLLVGAAVIGLWIASTAEIRNNYRHYLIGLAKAAAVQVDPALHERLRSPEQRDSPDYQRAVEPLRRMLAAVPDARFIYTGIRDGAQMRFVLDASPPGDQDGDGRDDRVGVGEVYAQKDPAKCPAFGTDSVPGVAVAYMEPFRDQWGTFITGWAPLLDQQGRQFGVVGVDVDASLYLGRLAAARRWMELGLLPAGLLIAGLAFGFYRIRLRALEATRTEALAARVLAKERERLQNIVEGTAVGTWEMELDSGAGIVDARWAQMIGRNVEQIGRIDRNTFFSLVHPDDRFGVASAVEACRRNPDQLLNIDLRMQHADGHWVWIGARGKVLTAGARGNGARMVGTHVDISERKAMELELAAAARSDRLTGLANRALFMQRLQEAMERVRQGRQARFAVLFLDFDRFKLVNDLLGHAAGDELLRGIAARLRAVLGEADGRDSTRAGRLIARFGGDEFLVLIEDSTGDAEIERIAARLHDVLAPLYRIRGREVRSTASIGIVTSDQCLESAEAVVRSADMAMYEAKRAGAGRSVWYSEEIGARGTQQLVIETGMFRKLNP